MDFGTRDRYRHAVEELARGARLPELEVARRAVRRRGRGCRTDAERPADPGYDLISRGRPAFERELGYRLPPAALAAARLRGLARRRATWAPSPLVTAG